MSDIINVLFIGDVVAEPGLKILEQNLSELKTKYKSDCVIANGENAAGGKGITEIEAERLFSAGVDIITSGNHIWDNWQGRPLLAKNPKVIRPLNYPAGNTGLGYTFLNVNERHNICVIQLQGRTFMQTIDCPFKAADFALKSISEKAKVIIVDFHADATAEKMSMAWHLDGRVTALLGTHTHIPTSDASILPNGTAYLTDVGMTGPNDSVVGMRKDIALKRFLLQTPHKYEVASDDVKICAVNLVVEASSGQALKIEQIILPKFENSVFNQIESE